MVARRKQPGIFRFRAVLLPVYGAPFRRLSPVFLHPVQPFDCLLQVGFRRGVVVVRKTVPHGPFAIGGRSCVERIGFPIIPDTEYLAAGHLECRRFLPRQGVELFRRHILGHLLHVFAGTADAVTPDVVAHLLFRVFLHDVVGSPDAAVVHHGEVLVLCHELVAPFRRSVA